MGNRRNYQERESEIALPKFTMKCNSHVIQLGVAQMKSPRRDKNVEHF